MILYEDKAPRLVTGVGTTVALAVGVADEVALGVADDAVEVVTAVLGPGVPIMEGRRRMTRKIKTKDYLVQVNFCSFTRL